MTGLCAVTSREREEPLTATASRVERWLVVEHTGAWGPESVPSSRMATSVARALADTAAGALAGLLLVRRPAGQRCDDGRWVFAVDSRPGLERVLARHVADDDELLSLDPPYGVATSEGWTAVAESLLLVCTHGRHDQCCALRGRPVAQVLAAAHGERVWESSHVGGDRFAANLVVLPEGHYFGRVEPEEVVGVVADLEAGQLPAGRVRGRSSLPLPTQAAQHFARTSTGRWGTHDHDPVLQEGVAPDTWRVRLTGDVEVVVRYDRNGDGERHVLSCGDPARTAPLFEQVSLRSLAATPA